MMSGDKKRPYVSMPAMNKVAEIDAAFWKVVSNIDAVVKPALTQRRTPSIWDDV